MLTLRLPDGSTHEVPGRSCPREAVEALGVRPEEAVAARVADQVIDLDAELPAQGEVAFQPLTTRDRDSLDVLWRSCGLLAARAVLRLFPGARVAGGPDVAAGFSCDLDVSPPLRREDLPRVEAEMRKLVARAEPFERLERPAEEARLLFDDLGQDYRAGPLAGAAQPAVVSLYRQGEFLDLSAGPHLPHAGLIAAFKLLDVTPVPGRERLQRLRGIAFFAQADLDAWLRQTPASRPH